MIESYVICHSNLLTLRFVCLCIVSESVSKKKALHSTQNIKLTNHAKEDFFLTKEVYLAKEDLAAINTANSTARYKKENENK